MSTHRSLLEDAGVLWVETDVRGHAPFPGGPFYESLAIEDYVAISREPAGSASLLPALKKQRKLMRNQA